jgi:hypothetical protein
MQRFLVLAALALAASPATAVTTSILVQDSSGTLVDVTTNGADLASGASLDGTYFASGGPGVLKSSVSVDLGPLLTDGYVSKGMGSQVSVTDVLTVDAPGIMSGNFLATILIDGLLTPRATSLGPSGNFALPNFTLRVELPDSGLTVFDFSVTVSNYGGFLGGNGSLNGQRYSGPYTGAFNFLVPFETLVGQNVKMTLRCGILAAGVRAGDTAGGDCDFAHTVSWGGVSKVFGPGNTQVLGASIIGNGGNYMNNFPVPEPANWALLIAGFGLVGAMARRRRGLLAA